jgi:HEAT repeat protein
MGVTAVLKNALRNEDVPSALLAVETLARISDPEVEAVLVNAFWQGYITVQRAIVAVLARIAGPGSTDFFMDLLHKHNDGKVLKSAAQFLGQKFKYAPAADALFELLDHQYDDVKEVALGACVAIGGEELQKRFRELFLGDDPVKRLMAVYALGRIDVNANLELLKTALEDASPDIRKHALEAVSTLCYQSEAWLDMLVPRLLDENRDVRQTVVEIMGRCFSPEIVPHLLNALGDADDWVKVRALEVLGQNKVVAAIPDVMILLEYPNKLVAIRAIECLGSIGGTAAFQALLSISNSEDFELMEAAEAAISRIQEEQEKEL